MALIAQSDLEARLGRNLTADEAEAFLITNQAVQAYVEKIIGSSVETVNPSSKLFDGGVQHLTINPCTSITDIKYVDEDNNVVETIDTDYYTCEPVNETLKTMIRCRYGKFYSGFNNIQITAKFSTYEDTKITAIIKNAMLEALENEINNSTNIKRESIEGYSIEFADQQTKSALNQLTYLFPEV